MANFMIRFFICNVFISGIIGILLIVKRIFKNNLSSRMQYNLWFLLLGLLTVPFIPFRLIGVPQILSWISSLRNFCFVETAYNTYFFATNIGADSGATGSNATEITMSILSDMNI